MWLLEERDCGLGICWDGGGRREKETEWVLDNKRKSRARLSIYQNPPRFQSPGSIHVL